MNRAFIAVDVQFDFLPGGALAVPDGDKVIPEIIDQFDRHDILVLTADWHPEDHFSFDDEPKFVDKSWPKHCVAGTKGSQIHEDIYIAAVDTGKPVLLVQKGTDKDVEAYSGFDGLVIDCWNLDHIPGLEQEFKEGKSNLVRALNALSVTEVSVGGLALDYCVQETALASAQAGWPTSVFANCTRPVSYLTGIEAAILIDQHTNGMVVLHG